LRLRALTGLFLVVAAAVLLSAATAVPRRVVRATGTIRAVNSVTILVPRIEGQGGNLTLATLTENGVMVSAGQSLAAFDRSNELKLLRDAETKFDDLEHQIEEKKAEHVSNAEKRISDLVQAQADFKKAEIENRKGPVLSAIDQEKNKVKVEDARDHVASLGRSNRFHDLAEESELHVLELQRDRQRVAVQRQTRNSERLLVKAPIRGMVALENVWRNNSMGHAQEGDQLWPGSPLLKLFDPSAMVVEVSVGEPDGAVLQPGAKATVHLDAFPDIRFTAQYSSASPVATSPLGMSVKSFTARFRLDQSDPHLLPDLSAAVDIEAPQ
jgi:HlyD family secretion protein